VPPWCPLGDAQCSRARAAARRDGDVGTGDHAGHGSAVFLPHTPDGSLRVRQPEHQPHKPYPIPSRRLPARRLPPELRSPTLQQLPDAGEHPRLARHASLSAHGNPHARQASARDTAPGAGTLARLWGGGVGNSRPKHREQWAARPRRPLVDKDT